MRAPSDEPPGETPAHGVFDEDMAARMRDEDDPITIEKRAAQAAFASAMYKAQADFKQYIDQHGLRTCIDEFEYDDLIAAIAGRV